MSYQEEKMQILTAVYLNGIVAGDEDKSGELLMSIPEASVALDELVKKHIIENSLEYNNKQSRSYFQPAIDPMKAHKNGYRLGVRELQASQRQVIDKEK